MTSNERKESANESSLTRAVLELISLLANGHDQLASRALVLAAIKLGVRRAWKLSGYLACALIWAGILGLPPTSP